MQSINVVKGDHVTKKKKPTIKGTFMKVLSDGKVHSISEIRKAVGRHYESRTGYGKTFLRERVDEARFRLQKANRIVRTSRGHYKQKKKK